MHRSHLQSFFLCTIVIFLLLFGPAQSVDEEECNYWNTLCSAIGNGVEYKKCIGDTIYYNSPVKSRWTMARFYCQSIFNGRQNADLLYITKDSQKASFLKFASELSSIGQNNNVFATSALCCARLKHTTGNPKVEKECAWPYSKASLIALSTQANLDAATTAAKAGQECKFMTIKINKSGQNTVVEYDMSPPSVSSSEDYSFICSYTRPTDCPLPTTTPRPTRPPPQTDRPTEAPNPDHNTARPTTPTPTALPPTTPTSSPPITDSPSNHDLQDCSAPANSKGIVHWPPVRPGETSVAECPPNSTGVAMWKCDADGRFSASGPHITCTQGWIEPIMVQVVESRDMNELRDRATELREVLDTTADRTIKYHGDLRSMVNIVQMIQWKTNVFAQESHGHVDHHQATVEHITRSVVKSCSKILEHEQVWENGARAESASMASTVLKYVQYAGVTYGCSEADANTATKLDSVIKDGDQANIYLSAFNMQYEQPIRFSYAGMNFSLTNSLDNTSVVNTEICNHTIGVGAVFEKLSKYLSLNMTALQLEINSEIVAFNYNNKSTTYDLPADTLAEMRLSHHKPLQFGAHPKCVFWDVEANDWSSRGCHLDRAASSVHHSVCQCNHLTSFSVLMDVSGREEPSDVKSILTYVCTSASVVCLVVTIALFAVCRELQNRRTTILINLSVSLIFVDCLVLFGLDQTEHEAICKGVSVLLLYWLLTSFSWMLMEGYQLYQMVILVFNNIGHLRMLYMYLIGYGVPLIMTAVSATLIHLNNGLTNEYFCWITSSRHPLQILALIVPATVVIIINTVIMYLVLRTVFQMKFGKKHASSGRSSSGGGKSSSGTTLSSSDSPPLSSPNHKSQRQRNLNLMSNGGGGGSSNGSSANSKRRLFEKGGGKSTELSNGHKPKNGNKAKSGGGEEVSLEKQITQWISYIKGYMSLIVLMGITWITYVLYIHEYGHFFSYVFIVLNGLQGVFIFITQFLFDSKTYSAVRKRICVCLGEDYFRSTTNSTTNSTTKNTMSSSYSTSTRTTTHNGHSMAQSVSETETETGPTLTGGDTVPPTVTAQVTMTTFPSPNHNGHVHNHSGLQQHPSSAQSGSSASVSPASTVNASSELVAHYHKQRKYSLEYF